MTKLDIITDVTNESKADFQTAGQNLVTGCAVTNTNFTFTGTTYADFKTSFETWVRLNSEGEISGDHIIIDNADNAEITAKANYKIIANQVNLQANHDRAKLLSSGGILTSEGGALGVLPQAVIKKVSSENPEEIRIELITFDKSVGTIVTWKDLTVSDSIMEHEFFAQKHIITFDGFISGHQYEITAGHKGTVRKVLFSNSVKVFIQ